MRRLMSRLMAKSTLMPRLTSMSVQVGLLSLRYSITAHYVTIYLIKREYSIFVIIYNSNVLSRFLKNEPYHLIKIFVDRFIKYGTIVPSMNFLNMTALLVFPGSAITIKLEKSVKTGMWSHVATIKSKLRQKNSLKAWPNTAEQCSTAILNKLCDV